MSEPSGGATRCPSDSAGELLALDLGTSRVKAGVFTRTGELLRFARSEYPLTRTADEGGRVEQNPEEWWTAVRQVVQRVLTDLGPAALAAICPGGQGPTLVLVDSDGRPVRPAISWMDVRADEQRRRLSERASQDVTPFSLIPRLMWVAENEPQVFDSARWALQSWDFLGHRLTGGTEPVASTIAGDRVWRSEWLAVSGVSDSPVPRHVDAGVPYGVTGGPWSAELGLPDGIPVVAGMNDGLASLVGAAGGITGRATDVGGTAGGLALCWDRPLHAPGVDAWPGFASGTYIAGGAFAAGGRALDWWAETVRQSPPIVLRAAARAPVGAQNLVFLPFLAGERAPLWDASARGAFLGLTFDHTAAHLARAVVESSGYSLRLLAESIVQGGGRFSELRVCGGQAQNRFWNQVKADVTGYQVAVPRVTEVALMGNAIIGAIGAGFQSDLLSGGEAMVRVGERLDPIATHRPVYDRLFGLYREAYAALKPLAPLLRSS